MISRFNRQLSLVGLAIVIAAVTGCVSVSSRSTVRHLLNGRDLNAFYPFLKEFGADHNPDGVFTLTNGLLRISGQHYGYLSTREEFANYRLVAEFKWGETTWPPRLNNARDSGVLVHTVGADAVWPRSIEAQIIEGGTGDILVVGGALLTVNGETKGPKIERFDRPGRNPWQDVKGFRGPNEIENPVGEWNVLEIVCDGDRVAVTVNGHQTLEGSNAVPRSGRIVIQSEGAEIFFRRLDLHCLP